MTIDPAAIELIQRFESCSLRPNWAGGASGIDIGWGCDIGAAPASLDAWEPLLDANAYGRLTTARGVTGAAAEALQLKLADIKIPQAAADKIFAEHDMPAALNQTLRAFPGADQLPGKSLGALVSLVFNRGARLTDVAGQRPRAEMRAIKDHLAAGAFDMVPLEFALMSRLWPDPKGPTASNLMGRRYAEGHLFEAGLRDVGMASSATLLLDDSGDRVKALQAALRITADGAFGPATLRALLAWQVAQGLHEHGIVDPLTLKSLNLS